MSSLLEAYQQDISTGNIRRDERQVRALTYLNDIYQQLSRPQAFWQKFLGRQQEIKGAYLWGGVGIGKTYMMDLFCRHLNEDSVKRLHFHAFMQQVHAELRVREGQSDPLIKIARQFAKRTRVICFDEFFVNDITDAMILANLFAALFKEGVILVATSNVEPDELYRNGLQRARFLPAIELIKQHCDVVYLDIETDYRLEKLQEAGVFFQGAPEDTSEKLAHLYTILTTEHEQLESVLEVDGRMIPVVCRTSHVVWFDFNVICHQPRSQMDYLVIADEFDTVIVSNVPQITAQQVDKITYWIHLVDILYDNKVKLILSTELSLEDIYTKGSKHFEYQRTLSRLQEMQSEQYLHDAHCQRVDT